MKHSAIWSFINFTKKIYTKHTALGYTRIPINYAIILMMIHREFWNIDEIQRTLKARKESINYAIERLLMDGLIVRGDVLGDDAVFTTQYAREHEFLRNEWLFMRLIRLAEQAMAHNKRITLRTAAIYLQILSEKRAAMSSLINFFDDAGDYAQLNGAIKVLEAIGLVEKQASEEDARERYLVPIGDANEK